MHFEFALDLSDLLDTDMPSKHFVCLYNVFKTSSRRVDDGMRVDHSDVKASTRKWP